MKFIKSREKNSWLFYFKNFLPCWAKARFTLFIFNPRPEGRGYKNLSVSHYSRLIIGIYTDSHNTF